jgi:hypothetical protein
VKTRLVPAACLVALAGLTISATMSLGGDGDGGAASGLDLSVSAVATSTSASSPDIQIVTAGVPGAPADNPAARFFGLAMGTVSCNVGTIRIPFQSVNTNPMSYNHPYIATNVYRINAQGRLEQLTAAWIKHAFSSASASQAAVPGPNGQPACGTGSCGTGSGPIMGLNCSDTYSSGLNLGMGNLAPRGEVVPNDVGINVDIGEPLPAGRTWLGYNPRGSFFDLFQGSSGSDIQGAATADGVKSYTTGSTNTPWKLNMIRTDEINTAALGPSGRVLMESYYVLNGDVSKMNNHAWRRFRYTQPANSGGNEVVPATSAFAFDGPHTFGPPIMTWGDQQQLAQPSSEGSVYVASRVVNLGNGQWRYEYNVYNMDLYRQVGGIEIPVPSIAEMSDMNTWRPRQQTFWLDPITNASGVITSARQRWIDNSPWTMSIDNTKDALMLAPVPVADNANPPSPTNPTLPNTIRWGTMYTYWYTSNFPPRMNGSAIITPYRSGGTIQTMTARVSVPKAPCDITGLGGLPALPDGQPTVDDIIAFVNAYGDGNLLADVANIGLQPIPDGQLTVDDVILFVNTYGDWM